MVGIVRILGEFKSLLFQASPSRTSNSGIFMVHEDLITSRIALSFFKVTNEENPSLNQNSK